MAATFSSATSFCMFCWAPCGSARHTTPAHRLAHDLVATLLKREIAALGQVIGLRRDIAGLGEQKANADRPGGPRPADKGQRQRRAPSTPTPASVWRRVSPVLFDDSIPLFRPVHYAG